MCFFWKIQCLFKWVLLSWIEINAILRFKLRFLLRNTGVDSDLTQNFWVKNWRLEPLGWRLCWRHSWGGTGGPQQADQEVQGARSKENFYREQLHWHLSPSLGQEPSNYYLNGAHNQKEEGQVDHLNRDWGAGGVTLSGGISCTSSFFSPTLNENILVLPLFFVLVCTQSFENRLESMDSYKR